MHRLRFVVELVGCAAIGALGGVIFRHNDPLFLVLFILGFGLCAAFLAHLVLGLRARWRYHYVTICRFFSLALVAMVCFAAVASTTEKADKQEARAYLDQIKPRLEQYRENTGHYPPTLGDVPDLPPPPPGFFYRWEKETVPGAPDNYRIDYYTLEYWSGTGEWFDTD